jgi:hypothetical protein
MDALEEVAKIMGLRSVPTNPAVKSALKETDERQTNSLP